MMITVIHRHLLTSEDSLAFELIQEIEQNAYILEILFGDVSETY